MTRLETNRWPDGDPRPPIYEPHTSLMEDWRNIDVVETPKWSKRDTWTGVLLALTAYALLFAYLLQDMGAK